MLEAAMKRKKMTQGDLARAAGISQPFVNDLLHGRRRLSVATAIKVGRALGVEPRRLLIEQIDTELARERGA